MATRSIELAIRMTADASDPVDAFHDVGTAASRMGDDVDRATSRVDSSASRLDNVASSAENLDDKAGKATGALGALSSGFELVGLDQYAGGLQAAGMATDFFSGVGQSLNLVMESQAVVTARAKAAAVAHAVTSRASAAASKAWAVAQRILNATMIASPIGLVVAGVILLVGAFVLAYKKSETFRSIVQGAMRAVQTAVGWVLDKVEAVADFVGDNLPRAFHKAEDLVSGSVDFIKGKVIDGFDAMLTPIQWVIDKVQTLIDWIGKIDFPDLPDLPGFLGGLTSSRTILPTGLDLGGKFGRTTTGGGTDPTPVSVVVKVEGFVGNENQLATVIAGMLARYFTRLGIQVPGWPQLIGQ